MSKFSYLIQRTQSVFAVPKQNKFKMQSQVVPLIVYDNFTYDRLPNNKY